METRAFPTHNFRDALHAHQRITRSVGFAIIRVGKAFTIDEVVFAEKSDLLLLGTRSLEGLSLTVDARRKKLVASGPLLAATALRRGVKLTLRQPRP